MNLPPVLLALMLFPFTTASAQLHETLAALTQRFGAPVAEQSEPLIPSREYEFHWNRWHIRAALIDGVCHAIRYDFQDSGPAPMDELLEENAAGGHWLRIGQMMSCLDDQGTISKRLHFPRSDYGAYLIQTDRGVWFKSAFRIGLEQELGPSKSLVVVKSRYFRTSAPKAISAPTPKTAAAPERPPLATVPTTDSGTLGKRPQASAFGLLPLPLPLPLPLSPPQQALVQSFGPTPPPTWMAVGILVLVILAWIGLLRFTSWFSDKGRAGERKVRSLLRRLDPAIYQCFHDVYFPRADGMGSTQIDHLVLSRHGVFVIETKNWSGWIFGTANQANWTQSFGKQNLTIQNPLHQNDLHLKSARAFLQLPVIAFHSLIFMVGAAKLRSPMPPNVLTGGFLQTIHGATTLVLDEETLRRAITRLEEWVRSPDHQKLRRQHLPFLASLHGSSKKITAKPDGSRAANQPEPLLNLARGALPQRDSRDYRTDGNPN